MAITDLLLIPLFVVWFGIIILMFLYKAKIIK